VHNIVLVAFRAASTRKDVFMDFDADTIDEMLERLARCSGAHAAAAGAALSASTVRKSGAMASGVDARRLSTAARGD
jgi:hypothetical protein